MKHCEDENGTSSSVKITGSREDLGRHHTLNFWLQSHGRYLKKNTTTEFMSKMYYARSGCHVCCSINIFLVSKEHVKPSDAMMQK